MNKRSNGAKKGEIQKLVQPRWPHLSQRFSHDAHGRPRAAAASSCIAAPRETHLTSAGRRTRARNPAASFIAEVRGPIDRCSVAVDHTRSRRGAFSVALPNPARGCAPAPITSWPHEPAVKGSIDRRSGRKSECSAPLPSWPRTLRVGYGFANRAGSQDGGKLRSGCPQRRSP